MTNQEIFELIDRFERSGIRSLRLTTGSVSLEMSRDAQGAAPSPVLAAPVQTAAQPAVQEDNVIAAPMAGVFYVASAPGAEPYVHVGDRIARGETICLMEAMKMISEIPAPCDCIITRIYKENGELAGFDEPLFGYRPC